MKLKEPVSLSPSAVNSISPVDYKEGVQVFLPDVSELECLPASGEITFKFCREEVSVRGGKMPARLSLLSIISVECDEDAEEAPLENAVDKLFAEASKEEEEKG